MDYTSYSLSTNISSELVNGSWKVKYVLTQGRKAEGGEWETREISSEATSPDVNKALAMAALTIEQYLSLVNSDLFQEVNRGDYLQ